MKIFQQQKSKKRLIFHLIPQVEDVLQIFTHPVVLDGQEDGVEDDAEGHNEVEDRVVDHLVQDVLGGQCVIKRWKKKSRIRILTGLFGFGIWVRIHEVQGGRLYITVRFRYLVKRDLSSER